MPSFDIDFSVYCGNCGAGLCLESEVGWERSQPAVYVNPCERCLEDARNESYKEGCDEGFDKGYDEGFERGVKNASDTF